MKQKSLMSFFGKPVAEKSSSDKTPAAKSSGMASSASNASKSHIPTTPQQKGSDMLALNSSVGVSSRSEGGGSSVKQTPPTSDSIDVDMFSAEEDEAKCVQAKKASIL